MICCYFIVYILSKTNKCISFAGLNTFRISLWLITNPYSGTGNDINDYLIISGEAHVIRHRNCGFNTKFYFLGCGVT